MKYESEQAERRSTIYLPSAGAPGPAQLRSPGKFKLPRHQDTSATLAGAYPFLAEGGLGSDGVFIGQDLYSGGSFVYDPWVLYARGLITAPNLVLAGIVGSGKSSLAKSFYTRSLPFGRRVYVPGGPKGEHAAVAEAVGSGDPLHHSTGHYLITGTSSYTRLEEINFIQRIPADENQLEDIRAAAHQFLAEIRDGAPVHPRYEQLKALVTAARVDRDVLLHRIAEEKLAEIKAGKKPKRRAPGAHVPAVVEPMSVRAFVITWNELGGLCAHTDPAAIAGKLTSEEAEMFFTVIDQWIDFADRLREALDRLGSDGEAE